MQRSREGRGGEEAEGRGKKGRKRKYRIKKGGKMREEEKELKK